MRSSRRLDVSFCGSDGTVSTAPPRLVRINDFVCRAIAQSREQLNLYRLSRFIVGLSHGADNVAAKVIVNTTLGAAAGALTVALMYQVINGVQVRISSAVITCHCEIYPSQFERKSPGPMLSP